ncbi:hypothetical protein FNV43_RR00111 [Rhamnella rubrinervis]|uniref:Glycosyltransferase n=1 Tax=Rhamnella rubrinervis TaxID=2594499 RepID=A0A8K0MR41_9ROSA|nr:hypothetical protein FNV43_RR00111 [Rhamnella rubrinervis]
MASHRRFLILAFPVQGHINPSLQFAKQLISTGAQATFVTTLSAHRRMSTGDSTFIGSLLFASFSDGFDDDGFKPGEDFEHYMSEFSHRGSQAVSDIIFSATNEGRPFTAFVYTIFMPWATELARELRLPSALLWIQPVTVFDMFYYYFHGCGDLIKNISYSPSHPIELPGLPLKLTSRDLPSFLHATNRATVGLRIFKAQFEMLDKESKPKVLVNTFDALEPEALRAIGGNKLDLIGIGPLIPSAFLDGKDPSDTSFGGDLFKHSSKDDNYMKWLNTKPEKSVIYVSFGSLCVLSNPQKEEIAKALLDFGCPFLWAIKSNKEDTVEEEDEVSCREELEKLGKVVSWCNQMEVLSSPSLCCFVTHCGWNSTLESVVSGVPMVAFPQTSEQTTNAKLVEDVWKMGVRVKANHEDGIVGRDEIKRCLELVMEDGEIGEGIRRNAEKWKGLSREAVKVGGSSDRNFKAFLNDL